MEACNDYPFSTGSTVSIGTKLERVVAHFNELKNSLHHQKRWINVVVLMMLSNQLKQLAKDYNLFISSSTQVNANAMLEEGFKNEGCIRGSKAIADLYFYK